MKVVIKRKPSRGRIPHRPTKVETVRVRYDRKKVKQVIRKELKLEEDEGA